MLRLLPRILLAAMIGFGASWITYAEVDRAQYHNEVRVLETQLERQLVMVDAVKQAQEYAGPIVELSKVLTQENQMFMKGIERAREVMRTQGVELAQTREALNSSMELMQDQIEENNRCIDHIRNLEDYIRLLMDKIPDEDCPPPPRLKEEEELL